MIFVIKGGRIVKQQVVLGVFAALLTVSFSSAFAAEESEQKAVVQKPAVVSSAQYGIYFDSASGNYFSNSQPSFSIRPTGNSKYLERIEVSINEGAFEAYKGSLKFSQEGLQKLNFRAVDPVLNWSPVQTFRVFVDLNAPKSSYHWKGAYYKGGDGHYVHPDAQMMLSAEDNLSGVSHILLKQSETEKPSRAPSAMQFKKEGVYSLNFASVDNVGNQEAWQSILFKVDATAPVSQADISGTFHKKDGKTFVNFGSQVILSATDAGSGVRQIEYRINDGTVSKYTAPIVISDPITQLKYRAIDQVGHEEGWKALTLHQDTAPPAIQLSKEGTYELSEGKIYALKGLKIKARVQDDQSGLGKLLVAKDSTSFEEIKGDLSFSFDQPGVYNLIVKAEDLVGNSAEAAPITVYIDDQAPAATIKSRQTLVQKDKLYLSGIPNMIEFTGDDVGVGLKHVEISFDGKTFTPARTPIDLATWTNSKQTIYYRAVDRLGNREQTQSMTVEVLTNGPRVDLFVESEGLPEIPLHSLGTKKTTTRGTASQ